MRSRPLALALVLATTLAPRCGSPVADGGVQLAVFSDPQGGFSTRDVRDSGGDIVRFDVGAGVLLWVDTGARFAGFPVSGNSIGPGGQFRVAFGREGGERRAYFTEAATGTLCDISIPGGALSIQPTSLPVPR